MDFKIVVIILLAVLSSTISIALGVIGSMLYKVVKDQQIAKNEFQEKLTKATKTK